MHIFFAVSGTNYCHRSSNTIASKIPSGMYVETLHFYLFFFHSSVPSYIYLFIFIHSFFCSTIYLFNYSLFISSIHPLIYLFFDYLFTYLFIYSFFWSRFLTFIYLFILLFFCPFVHLFLLFCLFIYPFIHFYFVRTTIHLFIYSFIFHTFIYYLFIFIYNFSLLHPSRHLPNHLFICVRTYILFNYLFVRPSLRLW